MYRLRGPKSITNFAVDPATGRPDPTRRIRLVLKAGTSCVMVNIRPGQTAQQAKEAFLSQSGAQQGGGGGGDAAADAAAGEAGALSPAPAAAQRPVLASLTSPPAHETRLAGTALAAYALPAGGPRFLSAADLAAAYEPVPAAESQQHGVVGLYRLRTAAAGAPALIGVVFISTEEPARQYLVVAEGPAAAAGGAVPASATASWLRRAAVTVDCWNFALYGGGQQQQPAPGEVVAAAAPGATADSPDGEVAPAAPGAPPAESAGAGAAAAEAAEPPRPPHPGFNLPRLPPAPMRPADWRLVGLRAPPGAPHAPPLKPSLVPRPPSAQTRQLRESAAGAARHGGFTMIEHATRMRDSPELYGLAPVEGVSVPASAAAGAASVPHDRIAPCRHDVCEFKNSGKDHFQLWAAVVGPAAAAAAAAAHGSAHRFIGTRTHLWRHEMSLLPHGCNRAACALCIAVEAHDLDLTSAERRPKLFEPKPAAAGAAATTGKRPAATLQLGDGGAAADPGAVQQATLAAAAAAAEMGSDGLWV